MTPGVQVLESPTLVEASTRTHCPYCAFQQCGMMIRVGAGTPAEVSPDPAFPVNNGQMCIKGFTSAACSTTRAA